MLFLTWMLSLLLSAMAAPPAQACPKIYAPVCGVDGATYANACMARADGVAVVHEGECRDDADEATDTGDEVEGADPANCFCPMVYAPVCGVDGVTYGNDCQAGCAGVRVAYEGRCRPSDDDDDDDDADDDVTDPEPPEECVCITLWDPVCGTDGVTYGNRCEAGCAGVGVAHAGECEPITCMAYWEGWYRNERGECVHGGGSGCSNPFPYDSKEECERDADGDPDPGECACPDVWAPVCGEDGTTYGNRCEAGCADVDVAYDGRCGASGGPGDVDCNTLYDPVCGVDGRTYGNGCEAARAGVDVAHPGECEPVTCDAYWEGWYVDQGGVCVEGGASGCSNPFPYDSEEACRRDQATDPCACPRIWAPVCGGDGVTYANDCQAECVDVDVVHEGECRPGTGPWPGDCLCTMEYDPVCGDDGVTYSNACHAGCAGVRVAHLGECIDDTCDAYWEGWYVGRGGVCVEGGASGCSNPFPYDSEEACRRSQGSGTEPGDEDPGDTGDEDTCMAYWEGWYVDRGGVCAQGSASGCSNPFPYDSEEACLRDQGSGTEPGDPDPGDSGDPDTCTAYWEGWYVGRGGVCVEGGASGCSNPFPYDSEEACLRDQGGGTEPGDEGEDSGSGDGSPGDTTAPGEDDGPEADDPDPEGQDDPPAGDESPPDGEGTTPADDDGEGSQASWDTAMPDRLADDEPVVSGTWGCHTAGGSAAPSGFGALALLTLLSLRRRQGSQGVNAR